jgi:hypothetical protein
MNQYKQVLELYLTDCEGQKKQTLGMFEIDDIKEAQRQFRIHYPRYKKRLELRMVDVEKSHLSFQWMATVIHNSLTGTTKSSARYGAVDVSDMKPFHIPISEIKNDAGYTSMTTKTGFDYIAFCSGEDPIVANTIAASHLLLDTLAQEEKNERMD